MRNRVLCFFLFLILFFAFFRVEAQTVLLEQNPAEDTLPKKFGKNLKHYTHFYVGLGFVTNYYDKESVKINSIRSGNFFLGFRYKRKISRFYALGYDFSLNGTSFNILQNNEKVFLDTINHTKEIYHYTSSELEFYNRFNFGKRGNTIGKFLDIGIYGAWVMTNYYFIKDKYPEAYTAANSDYYEVRTRKNKFVEPFVYGAKIRIGINQWVLYASYRISDIFVPSHNMIELPRLFAGIQIGFF